MNMIELTVPGMSCGGCAKTITRVLSELDPTARIELGLAERRVNVETSVSRDAVIARLSDAGFEPA
jgi:copper chaperone